MGFYLIKYASKGLYLWGRLGSIEREIESIVETLESLLQMIEEKKGDKWLQAKWEKKPKVVFEDILAKHMTR